MKNQYKLLSRALKILIPILVIAMPIMAFASTPPANFDPGVQLLPATVNLVRHDNNQYTATYTLGLVNNGNLNVVYFLAAYPKLGQGIQLNSISAQALGDAPAALSTFSPANNATYTTYDPSTVILGDEVTSQPNAWAHLAPGKSVQYKVTIEATVTSAVTSASTACSTADPHSTASGTGFRLDFQGEGNDPDGPTHNEWDGVGLLGTVCESSIVGLSVNPGPVTHSSTPVVLPGDKRTQTSAPIGNPVADTPAQMPAGTSGQTPTHALVKTPAQTSAQTPAQGGLVVTTPTATPAQAPAATSTATPVQTPVVTPVATPVQNSQTQLVSSQNQSARELYNPSTSRKATTPVSKDSDAIIHVVSHHPATQLRSNNSESIVIPTTHTPHVSAKHLFSDKELAMWLALVSITGMYLLYGAKKYSQQKIRFLRQSKVGTKATMHREAAPADVNSFAAVASTKGLHDSELHVIDVYAMHKRNETIVPAPTLPSVSSINSAGKVTHLLRSADGSPTRHDLASRVWNELVKRMSRQRVNVSAKQHDKAVH